MLVFKLCATLQVPSLSPIWADMSISIDTTNIIAAYSRVCCVHMKTGWTVIMYKGWNNADLHMLTSIDECSVLFPMTIGSSGPVTSLRGCYIKLLGEIQLFDFIFSNHPHDILNMTNDMKRTPGGIFTTGCTCIMCRYPIKFCSLFNLFYNHEAQKSFLKCRHLI